MESLRENLGPWTGNKSPPWLHSTNKACFSEYSNKSIVIPPTAINAPYNFSTDVFPNRAFYGIMPWSILEFHQIIASLLESDKNTYAF